MELIKFLTELPFLESNILILTILICSSFLRVCLVTLFINIGLGINNIFGNIWGLLLVLIISFHVSSPLINELDSIVIKNQSLSREEKIEKINESLRLKITSNDINYIDKPFSSILVSRVLSETKTAFNAGLKILLPFIVIDLVVANIFTALGIVTMSSYALAFLLKILAINFTGGLDLILDSLIKSF